VDFHRRLPRRQAVVESMMAGAFSREPKKVVFNIKCNDYRLVAALQYRAGVLAIRFFGTHGEYDRIDAETV
jgi:mRNA-degrading endonuclease HigB of HigAB toxin-antitoxin module